MRIHHLILVLSLWLSVFPAYGGASETLVVKISTGEYPPFTSEGLASKGFVNNIVKEAFALEGVKTEFRFLPWQRAYRDMVDGSVQASSYWYKNDARAAVALFSDEILEESFYFFSLKRPTPLSWNTLTDLKDLKIGVTQGYTYTDEFWLLGEQETLHLDIVKTDDINLRKLFNRRIDIFPMGYEAGLTLLMNKYPHNVRDQVVLVKKPLMTQKAYLLVSKKTINAEAIIMSFNKGLKSLKRSGRYQSLYQDRFIKNVPEHLRIPAK